MNSHLKNDTTLFSGLMIAVFVAQLAAGISFVHADKLASKQAVQPEVAVAYLEPVVIHGTRLVNQASIQSSEQKVPKSIASNLISVY